MASVMLLPDGLMFFRQPQESTPETVGRFFDGVARLRSASQGRILIDVTAWQSIDAAARRVLYERGLELRGTRIALVTATRLQRAMATFASLAARINLRCFDSMQEARDWLEN